VLAEILHFRFGDKIPLVAAPKYIVFCMEFSSPIRNVSAQESLMLNQNVLLALKR